MNKNDDWGHANTTSVSADALGTFEKRKFSTNRMFALAYLIVTIIIFEYTKPEFETLHDGALHAYLAGVAFLYCNVLVLIALVHSLVIFYLKFTRFDKGFDKE